MGGIEVSTLRPHPNPQRQSHHLVCNPPEPETDELHQVSIWIYTSRGSLGEKKVPCYSMPFVRRKKEIPGNGRQSRLRRQIPRGCGVYISIRAAISSLMPLTERSATSSSSPSLGLSLSSYWSLSSSADRSCKGLISTSSSGFQTSSGSSL